VNYQSAPQVPPSRQGVGPARQTKETIGVDVFLDWHDGTADELGKKVEALKGDLELSMITNRGVRVYPDGFPETFVTDQWRCRFFAPSRGLVVRHQQIVALLQRFTDAGLDFTKTEHLCSFDGQRGFSSEGE
jgi:isocitrate dehydrogenase